MSENNAAATIRDFYTAVDTKPHNRASLEAFFANDYVDHNRPPAPAEIVDRDVILGLFDQLAAGVPDARHKLEILSDIDSDRAIVYWAFTGTHTGQFYDFPATGNPVSLNGVDIFTVRDGQFTEHWHVEELAAMFAQMSAPTGGN